MRNKSHTPGAPPKDQNIPLPKKFQPMFRTQVNTAPFTRLSGQVPADAATWAQQMRGISTNHAQLDRPRLDTLTTCIGAVLDTDDRSTSTALAAGLLLRPGKARDAYISACGVDDPETGRILDTLAAEFKPDEWHTLTAEVARAAEGLA